MPTQPWDDDDRPPSAPARRWRWWHVAALVLVIVGAVGAVAGIAFPEKVADRWIGWQVRQVRQDILSGKLSPEALRDELLKREGGRLIARRLSEDPDPQVRAASIDTLTAHGTAVKKRDPQDPFSMPSTRLSDFDAEAALMRLLDDPDPAVRQKAIRAVSAIEEARGFEEPLLRILNSGATDERLIVSEHLAHWNGKAARRTFADPRQPKEVRLAVLRGAERYGWARVVEDHEDFARTMKQAQADADPELRQAATDALRRTARQE
jgi:hypothetical protein